MTSFRDPSKTGPGAVFRAPRDPKRPPRAPQEPPRGSPRRPKRATLEAFTGLQSSKTSIYKHIQKHIQTHIVFICFLPIYRSHRGPEIRPRGVPKELRNWRCEAFSFEPLPWKGPGPLWKPREAPRRAHEGPKRAPRGPQEGAQEGAKRGPACRAQARRRGPTPPSGYDGPRGAPDQPKTAQEGPKRRPREPQDGHEGSDRPQDGPQDGQEPQIILKTALKWKRRTLWTPRCQKKSRSPGGP